LEAIVHPFDFLMLFFSFIYTLALTHLLLAVNFMIRYRRKIVFNVPHAIWMFDALLLLTINWISLWDFHGVDAIALWSIAAGFVLAVTQYLACALVSPDLSNARDFDLNSFQNEQSRTYLSAFLFLIVVSLAINAGGSAMGVAKWVGENALVLPMVPAVAIPLFVRNQWVQIAGGVALAILNIAYALVYYPVLH
jgi:hypothetical protein